MKKKMIDDRAGWQNLSLRILYGRKRKIRCLLIILIIFVSLILYLWGINRAYPDTSYCGFPDKETHDEVAYWIEYHGIRFQDDCWQESDGTYYFEREGQKIKLVKGEK